MMKAKLGSVEEGRKELESALISARKFGYRTYEYQIRLAIAEIQMLSATSSARSYSHELEKDARAHGALLVANQAHTLAQTGG